MLSFSILPLFHQPHEDWWTTKLCPWKMIDTSVEDLRGAQETALCQCWSVSTYSHSCGLKFCMLLWSLRRVGGVFRQKSKTLCHQSVLQTILSLTSVSLRVRKLHLLIRSDLGRLPVDGWGCGPRCTWRQRDGFVWSVECDSSDMDSSVKWKSLSPVRLFVTVESMEFSRPE